MATLNQNGKIAQRLACHYDLFSQIAGLKKGMSKRTSFGFSAAFVCKA
jgi:hypothetical protein